MRQQADLLVVADRGRRRAHRARDVPHPQLVAQTRRAHDRTGSGARARSASAVAATSASESTCDGRISETNAPSNDTAASTHSAVCMLWMNGASFWSERPLARPEKILKSTSLGIEFATTAMTNAIEMTAPVFCTMTRVPAAMPRRAGGTTPIIAAVFGLLNMPEPIPTRSSQKADAR